MADSLANSKLVRVRALRAQAADLLAQGLPPRRAARTLVELHGCSRQTANRYIASVLLELQRDSLAEPMAAKRARMVAALEHIHGQALAAERTWPANGEPVTVPAPDLRSALGALQQLAVIQGLVGKPDDREPGK